MGLCSHHVCCLAWGVLALVPTGWSWWENGSFQEHSCRRVLPSTANISQWAVATPFVPMGPSRTSNQVWPSLVSGHWFYSWVLVHMKPHMHPSKLEFLFLPVLWNTCDQTLQDSKADSQQGSPPSDARPTGWGCLTWVSKFSLLWRIFYDIIILQLYKPHIIWNKDYVIYS